MRFPFAAALAVAAILFCGTGLVRAADEVVVRLTIRNHRFIPDRLEVPARTKVVMVVRNEDAEPEEFESIELKREKIVFPGTETRVIMGRIEPGEYPFFGEYHAETAKGVIVAK